MLYEKKTADQAEVIYRKFEFSSNVKLHAEMFHLAMTTFELKANEPKLILDKIQSRSYSV